MQPGASHQLKVDSALPQKVEGGYAEFLDNSISERASTSLRASWRASLVAQLLKNLPAMQETLV